MQKMESFSTDNRNLRQKTDIPVRQIGRYQKKDFGANNKRRIFLTKYKKKDASTKKKDITEVRFPYQQVKTARRNNFSANSKNTKEENFRCK